MRRTGGEAEAGWLRDGDRSQRAKDREEFMLPDDGYDYSKHMRSPGHGVYLAAVPLKGSSKAEEAPVRLGRDWRSLVTELHRRRA